MKNSIITFLLALLTTVVLAQDNQPQYLKNPAIPSFRLLMQDSATIFKTTDIPAGKPVVFIMFSPDCHHCEDLTTDIIKNIKRFSGVNIYMLTPMSIAMIKPFYEKMNLAKYKNIVVGKDHEFFFPGYYNAYDIPFIVVYNKNKKLVKALGQESKAEDILAAIK